MDKTPEEHWRELSEHLLTDITEWRRSHPKATFREIEDEVHTRMSRLEAQVIEDTAQQSTRRAWSGASPQERPTCPVCGTPLHGRGKHVRKLQGAAGQARHADPRIWNLPQVWDGAFSPSMRN
jgi:hypothetical protein